MLFTSAGILYLGIDFRGEVCYESRNENRKTGGTMIQANNDLFVLSGKSYTYAFGVYEGKLRQL